MKMSSDFLSDRAELTKIEPFTADFAAAAGVPDKDLFALQIVVEELVTNVIDYGGVPAGEPAARVDLEVADGVLTMVITDSGREYNPLLREDPDVTLSAEDRPIGGLGVHFCKKLTETQSYARTAGKNILTLTRKLSA
jgi:serine/threonine-protein kinase RsbW